MTDRTIVPLVGHHGTWFAISDVPARRFNLPVEVRALVLLVFTFECFAAFVTQDILVPTLPIGVLLEFLNLSGIISRVEHYTYTAESYHLTTMIELIVELIEGTGML